MQRPNPPWRNVVVRFCPKCRLEFPPETLHCPRCQAELVDKIRRVPLAER